MRQSALLKKRVYAMTTDLFLITVSNYFFVASFTSFLKTVFFHLPLRTQLFLVHRLTAFSSVSLLSLTFAYFSLFYFLTNGHTMGKLLFGLKVENADKSELTLVQSMKRSFAYSFCAMLGSFLFAVSFFRKDEKSLADLFSGSTVALETKKEAALVAEKGTEFQLTLLKTMEEGVTPEAISSSEDDPEYLDQNKVA